MSERNLSGIYFKAKRFSRFENVCFEDLTEEEQDKILEKANKEFIKNLAKGLAKTINEIGIELDIIKQ